MAKVAPPKGPESQQPSKALRMVPYAVATIVLLAVAIHIRPDQFGISVYNVSKITGAAWLAYVIDTALCKYSWPRLTEDMPRDLVTAARLLSRPLYFLGCVLGFGSLG